MKKFLLVGAGRQGAAVAAFLLEQFDDTLVELLDHSAESLASTTSRMRYPHRVVSHQLDVFAAGAEVARLMAGADCVICALPYDMGPAMARISLQAGRPFCDLGGNVRVTEQLLAMDESARAAGVSLVADCGLAPGLTASLGEYWTKEWEYESVKLYCGGLPQHPRGVLRYSLTFNVCGLLNEYLEDCVISRGSEVRIVEGMSEPERLEDLPVEGDFEGFLTSGNASIAPLLYAPKGVDYQYKTIRYAGHRDVFCGMREMGLFDRKARKVVVNGGSITAAPWDLVGEILEVSLASQDNQDFVVARAEVIGRQDGRRKMGRVDVLDYSDDRFTSMVRLTGFPAAVVAATQAELYAARIAPGATVQLAVLDTRFLIDELRRAGVTGITVSERDLPAVESSGQPRRERQEVATEIGQGIAG
jgi:lysine 6-dehydrogenase